jgi:hypothetical protein
MNRIYLQKVSFCEISGRILTAETAEDAEKVTQKTILMKLKVTEYTLNIKYVLKISANPAVSAVKSKNYGT